LRVNLDLNLSQPVDEPTAQPVERPSVEEVIIIGSGPAGLSAAIYTARAALNPLLIAGGELGGQVATTTDVENYPGFPEMVTGPELYERMQQQAVKFGTAIVQDLVAELVVDQWPFRVTTVGGQTYRTKSLIIASGASPRKMGVDGEQRLTGRGVSYCATCDGFFFRGKELAVVGGGDSALQEAIFLTKFATKVHVLHRRGQLRASVALQQRAAKNPKIDYVWNTQVVAANGENKLSSLTLRDSITGAERDFPVDGVFAYIGHFPNNQFFLGKLATDEHGYLLTDKLMRTNVPGIFAAGEIQDPRFRQVATSVGQGVAAALEVEKWLAERESLPEAEMVR
jgi:thioredoxin reductase (NADPH)